MKIKNPNTDPVAFKVKTTAPKQYASPVFSAIRTYKNPDLTSAIDTACAPTLVALNPAMKSKSPVRHRPSGYFLSHRHLSNSVFRSSAPGDEDGAAPRCPMPRQVPRSVG